MEETLSIEIRRGSVNRHPIGSAYYSLTKAQQTSVDAILDAYPGCRVVASRGGAEAPLYLEITHEAEDGWVNDTLTIEVDGTSHTFAPLVPRGSEESAVALTNMVGELLVPEVPVEERAETLRQFVVDVAKARVGDKAEEFTWEAVKIVEALKDATARAEMLLLMDAEESGDRDLLEGMVDLMPTDEEQSRSGRAKSIAGWLTEAVPLMRHAGISAEEIAAVNDRQNPTVLSVGTAPAKRIAEDPELEPEEKEEQYRKLLKDMRTKSSRQVSKDWTDHRIPPVEVQQVYRNDQQLAIVAINHGDIQAASFYNRLGDWYEVVEEDILFPITLGDILRMPYEKLLRTAAFGGPGSRARCFCYDTVKREGTMSTNVLIEMSEMPRSEVLIALSELEEARLLEETEQVWRIPDDV
jgi:hypothetical protein